MAFVKKTWQSRISEYPNRRTITDENGVTKPVTVGRAEGVITQEGDGFTASNMNDLEQRIYNAFSGGGGGGGSANIISTASGSIATFSDGGDNIPVKSLITDITAIQAGTGTPSPDNVRAITGVDEVDVVVCGKNFTQITEETGSHNGITYTFNDDGTISASGSVPSGNSYKNVGHFILQAGTYTISGLPSSLVAEVRKCAMVLCKGAYSGSVNIIKTIYSNVALSSQFTLTEVTDCYLRIYVYTAAGAISDVIFKPQIELGETATSFEKFKGTTHTITLPETIYGGTLDVSTGDGIKTHEYIASYNGETINEPWISSIDEYVPNTNPSTGAQVVYPLTTPTTFITTPEQIPTLSGLNNIYSNSGDVEVEYFNENADQMAALIRVMTYTNETILLTLTCPRTQTSNLQYEVYNHFITRNCKMSIRTSGLTDCGSNEAYLALLVNGVEIQRGTLITDTTTEIDFSPVDVNQGDTVKLIFGWVNNHGAQFSGEGRMVLF